MKEMEKLSQDKVRTVAEAPVKKEIKLIGSLIRQPDHTLWEYNEVTQEIRKAQFEQTSIDLSAASITGGLEPEIKVKYRHKVKYNPFCVYVQALNVKNALRKLKV